MICFKIQGSGGFTVPFPKPCPGSAIRLEVVYLSYFYTELDLVQP